MKKLLLSGSSGGIGQAVKAAAAARGWSITEINRADYENPAPLAAVKTDGPFDAVVFASGTCPVRPVAQTSDELLTDTFKTNCGLFLRLMREILTHKAYSAQGMNVVAISSVSAVEGWPGGAAYCASKGALSAMCRAMDSELKSKRISVTALEPRYVKTRMFDQCAGRMGMPAEKALAPSVLADEILRLAAGVIFSSEKITPRDEASGNRQ